MAIDYDFGNRGRYLRQRYRILWGAITFTCLTYLLLASIYGSVIWAIIDLACRLLNSKLLPLSISIYCQLKTQKNISMTIKATSLTISMLTTALFWIETLKCITSKQILTSIAFIMMTSSMETFSALLAICAGNSAVVTICNQVVADVRFSNVDKSSNVYKSSNGAYLNLATVLEPQNIGFEAL